MDTTATTSAFATLNLADLDDDEEVRQVGNVSLDPGEEEEVFYAVGRLLANKPPKYLFFRDTMASVWRPAMGMNVKELQPKRFLFEFYHENDISRIIDGGPWAFEQSLLVMKRISADEDPELIVLDSAEFWIQVHNLPTGFRSDGVLQAIGSFIGRVIKLDDRNFDGTMRSFFRLRVEINVQKALKKGMKLNKDNGEWVRVEFRYERLPTFCFICGIIGHGDKFCHRLVQGWDSTSVKPYGPELRAGGRRNIPTAGQEWIAPATRLERRQWAAPGRWSEQNDKGKNPIIPIPNPLTIQIRDSPRDILHDTSILNKVTVMHDLNKESRDCMLDFEVGLTISDQKRRRTELDDELVSDIVGPMEIESMGPKNLLLAGAGVAQPRPSQ